METLTISSQFQQDLEIIEGWLPVSGKEEKFDSTSRLDIQEI
jgi:hypothetical protein